MELQGKINSALSLLDECYCEVYSKAKGMTDEAHYNRIQLQNIKKAIECVEKIKLK